MGILDTLEKLGGKAKNVYHKGDISEIEQFARYDYRLDPFKKAARKAGKEIAYSGGIARARIKEEMPKQLERLGGAVEREFHKTAEDQLAEIKKNEQRLDREERKLALKVREQRIKQRQRQYSAMSSIGSGIAFQPGPVFGQPKKRGRTIWD